MFEANIEENLGQAGFDEFVRDVYEMVDKVNAELKRRFDEKNIVMMQCVTSLIFYFNTLNHEKICIALPSGNLAPAPGNFWGHH